MKSKSCRSPVGILGISISLLLLSPQAPVWAQTVVATIPIGMPPRGVAVNPEGNKVYVAPCISSSGGPATPGNVIAIDGTTNATTTIPAGVCPTALALNPMTNTIYVANFGHTSLICGSCINYGSITVIDGATDATTTVTDPNAKFPQAMAVNSVTNKIYVANESGNVTVIDGVTNSTTTVTDPHANGLSAVALAVNPATNKIYVANTGGTNRGNVTVIDGATNSTITITDPNAINPVSVAVNSTTNKIYVANLGDYPGSNQGNVTVIDGATNSVTTLTDPNALSPGGPNSRGFAVCVDSATNKIYVSNEGSNNVTIIDGVTNSISTVTDPNALAPIAVAVDAATNTIYVANAGCGSASGCSNPGSVTVISGATNSVTTIIDPHATGPDAVAVNPMTNMIYVANGLFGGSSNVTAINGGASATTHTLSLTLAGSGKGTVTSIPAGINCGTTSCSSSFPTGTAVTLTASPASGSTFSGWSTACTGAGTCNLTMSSDEFVTATFSTAPPPDFSVTAVSASLTVLPGGRKTDAITLSPQNGSFATAIQLTCTVAGSAPLPTCGLNPTSVTPVANSASSTLTVTAPTASAMLQPSTPRRLKFLYAAWLPLPGIVLLGIGFISRKQRRQRRNLWFFAGSLLALFAVVGGCGGGSSSPPPQNYTVTVTGTSGAIQHTTQVTVIIP